MHEEKAIARREFVIYRIEALVVAGDALDVFVKLEAGAARIEGGAKIVEISRVVGMHRRERDTVTAEVSGRLDEPRIQIACHVRAMRIAAEDEALDARARSTATTSAGSCGCAAISHELFVANQRRIAAKSRGG